MSKVTHIDDIGQTLQDVLDYKDHIKAVVIVTVDNDNAVDVMASDFGNLQVVGLLEMAKINAAFNYE